MSGRTFGGGGGVDIAYSDVYLDKGFTGPENRGGVYARTLQPQALDYPGERSGAVATPDIRIQGLSRVIGPVAGPDNNGLGAIESGEFDPQDFFMGTEAKILGGIFLQDIVEGSTDLTHGVPTITSRQDGDQQITRLNFAPTLKSDPDNIFKPDPRENTNEPIGSMLIDATVITDLANPLASTTTIDGDIRGFTMSMLGDEFPLVDLHFRRLRFHSETGEEGTVEPDIDSVTFPDGSILHFLQELQDLLTFGDSGPEIEVTPTEVSALVTVPIPSIEIGVFSLQNLAFSAGLVIPFSGQPARARFAFCSREDPFLVSVMIFGGGGWFALALGLDGLESFEAGIEAGVCCSVDLGVASGSVEMMLGIYFFVGDDGSGTDKAVLEGYFRMFGEVEVMCIASVSMEAYIGFTYDFESNKVGGMASITLTVEVLCFSGSVTVSIERHFGGEGDPTFGQMLPADEGDPAHSRYWTDYCSAFAPSLPQ